MSRTEPELQTDRELLEEILMRVKDLEQEVAQIREEIK